VSAQQQNPRRRLAPELELRRPTRRAPEQAVTERGHPRITSAADIGLASETGPLPPVVGEGADRYATFANASRVRFSGVPDAVQATSSSMRMPPYGFRRRTTSQAM